MNGVVVGACTHHLQAHPPGHATTGSILTRTHGPSHVARSVGAADTKGNAWN